MRYSSPISTVTTRDLSTVTRELNEARAWRNNTGKEDPVSRWKREALESEERRAREREKSRNLTDYESVKQIEFLQQLVADARAAIFEHIASLQQSHIDALGDAFGKERRKMREQLTRHIDEQLAKLKTGPAGPRGVAGARGEYGARGPEGKAGPRGTPGSEIMSWKVDKAKYTATPVFNDGTPGPVLELRELFVQFVSDWRK
jgi:hypothetical protein